MYFDFSQKSALLLIFFSHGIVFTILLFVQGVNHRRASSVWLAAFVFLCCLYIAPFMLGYAGWYGASGYREFLFYMPLQQLLLIGPVMYFYVKLLLNPSLVIRKKELVHFLPALAYLIYSLVVFSGDVLVFEKVYFYQDGRDKDFDTWYQVAGLFSMLFYFGISLKYYWNYKRIAFQVVSFAETVLFRWIERYLAAMLLIMVLRVLFFALNPEWGAFGSKFWYYLCFSILFYYISVSGYVRALQLIVSSNMVSGRLSAGNPLTILNNESETLGLNDATSAQPLPDIESWKERLENLVYQKRLYENPALTLVNLSEALSTTPKQVSQVINQGFEVNFNDYINNHRIQAVIEKLKNNEHRSKTILALALECGFNSKSTFNRAFKKNVGKSPKDFIENQLKEVPEHDLKR